MYDSVEISNFNHQIIVHVNEGSDGTLDFIKEKKIGELTHDCK